MPEFSQLIFTAAIVAVVCCSLVGLGVYINKFIDWVITGLAPDDNEEE